MADTDQFTDQQILGMTLWGECRSGGEEGMTSVANVIVNRANAPGWWGADIRSVCLAPEQFSCWNSNDPNRAQMLALTPESPQFPLALSIAGQAIAGTLVDITNGSTYYYASSMIRPPSWAAGKTPAATIAGQIFFNNVA
jgi:spore germination cell wall hydrolase CwlJ-like protein